MQRTEEAIHAILERIKLTGLSYDSSRNPIGKLFQASTSFLKHNPNTVTSYDTVAVYLPSDHGGHHETIDTFNGTKSVYEIAIYMRLINLADGTLIGDREKAFKRFYEVNSLIHRHFYQFIGQRSTLRNYTYSIKDNTVMVIKYHFLTSSDHENDFPDIPTPPETPAS